MEVGPVIDVAVVTVPEEAMLLELLPARAALLLLLDPMIGRRPYEDVGRGIVDAAVPVDVIAIPGCGCCAIPLED